MPAREPRSSGFTLVEVAIALAILGVGLLLGMSFILGEARAVRRLDADRAARAALTGTLEAIRSGLLPLEAAHVEGGDLAAFGAVASPPDLAIDVDVAPASPPGLYAIALRARYRVQGEERERRLGSLIWRPSGAASP